MTVVLALETTTEVCSVALGSEDDYVEESRIVPRQHNKHVLEMIDRLCRVSQYTKRDIECVAFSAGPGSFTGVRIAAAVAQGIALSLTAKTYQAASALVFADAVCAQTQLPAVVSIVRRSRRDWSYVAIVRTDDSECTFVERDELLHADLLSDLENPVSDAHWYTSVKPVFKRALRHREAWREGIDAVPIYIDGDSPWRRQQ